MAERNLLTIQCSPMSLVIKNGGTRKLNAYITSTQDLDDGTLGWWKQYLVPALSKYQRVDNISSIRIEIEEEN